MLVWNIPFWHLHADHYCPWKEHLQQLEVEYKINPLIKYVLYSDTGSTWYTTSPTIFDTCWWIHITIGEYKRYRLHPIHSRTAYLFLNPGEACAMKRCRLWLASRAVSLFISFCPFLLFFFLVLSSLFILYFFLRCIRLHRWTQDKRRCHSDGTESCWAC